MTKEEKAKKKQLLLNKKRTMELLKKAGIKVVQKTGAMLMPAKSSSGIITPEAEEKR